MVQVKCAVGTQSVDSLRSHAERGNERSVMRRDRLLRRRKQARDGFTFAEMLLVLAVLLIVMGLVFPPVLRMMADQPLKEGAERARTKLASTRSS